MTLRKVSPLYLLILIVGCSAATSGGSTRADLDRLEREEILAANRGNAYELVEMLRPHWLGTRSDVSVNATPGIMVYVDNIRYGDLQSLRILNAREIYLIQRYNSTAASLRWGPGHSEGVLDISTRVESLSPDD